MINPNDHLGIGYSVVLSFLRKNPHLYSEKEDLEQEALLGIVEAAKRFKDTGDIQFTTFAAIEAYNKILMYLRDNYNRYRRIVSCSVEDLLTLESEGDPLSWEEVIEGTVVDLDKMIERLPSDHREFIKLVNKGLTKQEIRDRLKIGWQQYAQLEQEIKDSLKN